MSRDRFGLVKDPPHPVLFELLYEPQLDADRRNSLPLLVQIDAAHVVMLAERGLLARESCASLLAVNRDLAGRIERGEDVLGSPPAHRGLYMLYENEYISALGLEVGGAAHLARSRNDINATIVRMRLRLTLQDLVSRCLELARAGLSKAESHVDTVMAGFTHLQPAQPTTFGHYLAGVVSELSRSIDALSMAYEAVDRCPMGAAAGYGTSLPIDRGRVAELLGFSGVIENSLDAVASRDYLVSVLGPLSLLGITMTRMAADLQSWGSAAYGFLDWQDRLISTSSIMPQKRNAYVFENVRGKAVRPAAALGAVLLGLKNVGFSNSVEVSGEVTANLWPALDSAESAVRLLTVLVEEVQVDSVRMLEFLEDAETTMTELANLLAARAGISFRAAHEAVAEIVREGIREPALVLRRLSEILTSDLRLEPAEVEAALDATTCARSSELGGGPGPESVRRQIEGLTDRIRALEERLRDREAALRSATKRLSSAAEAVMGTA